MADKVILILSDGMTGESVLKCGHPFAAECVKKYPCNLNAQTVMPSVTLPCHMSLFLSVPPQRHGVFTNTYVPQVRPVTSLINRLHDDGKSCAMFYNWEELRDISRPGALSYSLFLGDNSELKNDAFLADSAIQYIKENEPDFVFLYFGCTDSIGHRLGWESDEYQKGIAHSFDSIEKIYNSLPKDYAIIVTADHGGHERTHGHDIPQDMTIPIMIISDDLTKVDGLPQDSTIMDIAPTITKIIGTKPDKDWEGRSLI